MCPHTVHDGLDSTYEGLKRLFGGEAVTPPPRLDSTYEGLKLAATTSSAMVGSFGQYL